MARLYAARNAPITATTMTISEPRLFCSEDAADGCVLPTTQSIEHWNAILSGFFTIESSGHVWNWLGVM